MKKNVFDQLRIVGLFCLVLTAATFVGCVEDEDPTPNGDAPVASFQFEVNAENFLAVSFSNFSQNATSYVWDFGDGVGTSTDENPSYIYAEAGIYTVKLAVSNAAGVSAERENVVTITDPNAASRILTGANGKVWQLLADDTQGGLPIHVGPVDRSQVWWSLGGGFDALCVRECILDDTWTFNTDGTFTFDNNGDFWGEGGIWPEELVGCFDATNAANFVGSGGQDLSGWNSGTHDFAYDPSSQTLTINGGFLGLSKAGTEGEFDAPQASVTYSVMKAVDSEVDTLVLQTKLIDGDGVEFGYWAFTMVSYDNAADEVMVGDCAPVEAVNVSFKVNMADYVESFTNVYVSGSFNNWSGDGFPLTDENNDKIFEGTTEIAVGEHEYKFTLDNWAEEEEFDGSESCVISIVDGENTFNNRYLNVGTVDQTEGTFCWNTCENCPFDLTAADLQGKAWTFESARVGNEGIGSGNFFNSATTEGWNDGKDCLFDDSFTFGTDGNLAIAIGDQMFGEDFMTGIETTGCYDIADVPANLTAWTGGSFAYTFSAASEDANAKIAVVGKGAYVGFYKGASGSEYREPADGTITYEVISFTGKTMEIAVDISAEQQGSGNWWTYVLITE